MFGSEHCLRFWTTNRALEEGRKLSPRFATDSEQVTLRRCAQSVTVAVVCLCAPSGHNVVVASMENLLCFVPAPYPSKRRDPTRSNFKHILKRQLCAARIQVKRTGLEMCSSQELCQSVRIADEGYGRLARSEPKPMTRCKVVAP